MKNYSCAIIDLTEAIKRDPGGANGTSNSLFLLVCLIFYLIGNAHLMRIVENINTNKQN